MALSTSQQKKYLLWQTKLFTAAKHDVGALQLEWVWQQRNW